MGGQPLQDSRFARRLGARITLLCCCRFCALPAQWSTRSSMKTEARSRGGAEGIAAPRHITAHLITHFWVGSGACRSSRTRTAPHTRGQTNNKTLARRAETADAHQRPPCFHFFVVATSPHATPFRRCDETPSPKDIVAHRTHNTPQNDTAVTRRVYPQ